MNLDIGVNVLVALLLAATRSAAWLMVCPPFNGKAIPMTVKGMLAVGLALPVVPRLSAGSVPSLDTWSLVIAAGEQVVVGAGLGFLTAVIFAGVQAAGDLLDVFGGFSLAFAFDPMSFSGNNAVLGRFYGLLATTLLFVTGSHQVIIRGFTLSYDAIPLDGGLSLGRLGTLLTTGLGQLLLSAAQIAGPLIVVLFCADVGLGLLNRIAPALNPFQIGFPAKIGLTLVLVGLTMPMLPMSVENIAKHAASAVMEAIGR
ncbi:flagellar biosynthetic protein FliR [Actinosynnema mirum]|uniref:Type III secretion system inner membrane R protein n=1 Tax=Actinosynnema mirum (strain ATCC 29888 / DSM 43827 / JCM 3225 / NBRC 14064 / NCIMB 13271 / NRRL B-12336 / IMRU 3971 / 101) TaxID=446462 RepID=C6WJP4_ACTMD|nr:flagellar biosynthetic protein FliR [Actinosynnema mirum]ACU36269.1 type III secretion system inner membrane R protein [Actinosynnema mirum DSM 43827]